MKRFFAFGCSFTSYNTPTWADFLGVNFDEYYNFGLAGASNSYILYNFTKALNEYQFNSETDYIAIMFTTHFRYSYFTENTGWVTNGDVLLKTPHVELESLYNFFKNNLWSLELGILQSWVAVKTIQKILNDNNIQHKFMLIDTDNENIPDSLSKTNIYLKEFLEVTTECLTMKQFIEKNKLPPLVWLEDGQIIRDGHPSINSHYLYFKYIFNEYNTDKSLEFYNERMESFVYDKELYSQAFLKKIKNTYNRVSNFKKYINA